ncbi:hypothetical protein RA279_30455, partial [Pseudomonas syringae pv. tagetis]|uniref:hypothetical protein n=1 Tax=Pseudomonas syringae group genomosp. 7 TaxID=251699 RepID=UPI00376F51D2
KFQKAANFQHAWRVRVSAFRITFKYEHAEKSCGTLTGKSIDDAARSVPGPVTPEAFGGALVFESVGF